MSPENIEANRLLYQHYFLKKLLYKYTDALTNANLMKCNLKFLKSCLDDRIIPKSLIPHNIRTKDLPFPHIYESLLKYHIQETERKVNISFFLTKTRFNNFQRYFYNLSDHYNILTIYIDKAHNLMKIKVNHRKNSQQQKLEKLLNESSWAKNLIQI